MKQEKLEKWQAAFPELFRDVECGFDLPTAWSDLVFDLCAAIEVEIEDNSLPKDYIQVVQVKAKFGQLRFYTKTHQAPMIQSIRNLIQQAEADAPVLGAN